MFAIQLLATHLPVLIIGWIDSHDSSLLAGALPFHRANWWSGKRYVKYCQGTLLKAIMTTY